jgi:hypothetical protein
MWRNENVAMASMASAIIIWQAWTSSGENAINRNEGVKMA